MPFVPVFLWTDRLVWLLVVIAIVYGWYCSRRPHLAAPWARVFRSRAAVMCTVVLSAFLVIGLLDSVHFRLRLKDAGTQATEAYAPEVLSILDLLLTTMRERREKTYSAPLATRSYSKELVTIESGPDKGKQLRDFPRLRHGGKDLDSEDRATIDIATRILAGLFGGVGLWLLLQLALKPLARWRPEVPWEAGWLTLGMVLVVTGPVIMLAGGYHVLGTDKVGQDVLYLSLKSIRTSLVIGTLTTLVLLPLGIALGIMAGYFKGWVDDVIQYLYTTLNSIPGVLLIAAAVLMMQVYIDTHPELFPTAAQRADLRLLFLCVILGLTSWTGLARLLRGETLKLSELEFIQAAHAFGVRDVRILARHVMPNIAHIVIIVLVMDFSGLVLAEAVLSYVGVGVDPSTFSFGTMINTARLEMSREPIVWWSLAAAFFFMFVLVLAANLFADAVRDGFDPRVRMGAAAA